MAKSKKTSDAFDMADDIRKEVAAESVADACSTSVPAIYSLAKGDNPRRAKYDKNADVIGYNLRLPANIHRLLKRHCMETNESMNNVVLVTVANLFCVTAPGKKLIAYSGIFEQVIVTLRSNEFRECVIGHALARLCLLNPRRVQKCRAPLHVAQLPFFLEQ